MAKPALESQRSAATENPYKFSNCSTAGSTRGRPFTSNARKGMWGDQGKSMRGSHFEDMGDGGALAHEGAAHDAVRPRRKGGFAPVL